MYVYHKWKNDVCVKCGLKRELKPINDFLENKENNLKKWYRGGFHFVYEGSLKVPECTEKLHPISKGTIELYYNEEVIRRKIFNKNCQIKYFMKLCNDTLIKTSPYKHKFYFEVKPD